MMTSKTTKALPFTLKNQEGRDVSLEDFSGQWLILYFYPQDDTPGCTIEAKGFTNYFADFEKLDTVIIGISKDSATCHANFKHKYSIPFYLLSDESAAVIQQYNAWAPKSMFGKDYMGIERTTYLIDKSGKIAFIWPKVKVDNHALEVLAKVKSLQR